MLRRIGRSLFRLLAATLLLLLLLCAVEVGFRVRKVQRLMEAETLGTERDAIVAPSSLSWIDVIPLLNRQVMPAGTPTQEPGASKPFTPIRTSEYGTRGTAPIVPRPAGKYRVLILGGDTVFGTGLDEPMTLAGRLANRLGGASTDALEIVNAGCPGAGPLVNLLRFRHHLSTLQPNLVLYVLTADDLLGDVPIRGSIRFDGNKLPAYAPHPKFTSSGDPCFDGVCEQFAVAEWLLGKVHETSGSSASVVDRERTLKDPDGIKRLLAPLVVLARLTESQGSRLAVSIAPTAWDMRRSDASGVNDLPSGPALAVILKGLDPQGSILLQDTVERFQSVQDKVPLFRKPSGLLSGEGTEAYSQLVAEFLTGDPSRTNVPPVGGGPSIPETSAVPNAVPGRQ